MEEIDEKINEFIEFLNSGYVPKSQDFEKEFSSGKPLGNFWFRNKEMIKQELVTNPKYLNGYELAKRVLSCETVNDYKIREYIELLNNGYIPKSKDNITKFVTTDRYIGNFWPYNKDKIIYELNNNPIYSNYVLAKKICDVKNDKKLYIDPNTSKKRKKVRVKDILEKFDIDLETFNNIFCCFKNPDGKKNLSFKYHTGISLKTYCENIGYDYKLILKTIKLKKFFEKDGLEELLNKSLKSYSSENINEEHWIFKKYGNKIEQKLKFLNLDSEFIFKEMSNNVINIEQAIKKLVFENNVSSESKWIIDVYNDLINKLNSGKIVTEDDIASKIKKLAKDNCLTIKERKELETSFIVYINTIRDYYKVDVALEDDLKIKKEKIIKYHLDEYEIEESYLINLEFDNNELINSNSDLYKKRQLLRQYIIDWDDYTKIEKIKIKNSNLFTDEDISLIDKTRYDLNNIIKVYKK